MPVGIMPGNTLVIVRHHATLHGLLIHAVPDQVHTPYGIQGEAKARYQYKRQIC
jgi:hypothetical protein